ncbi:MAG: hypothetical protein ACI9F9_002483 [Candidatus Paceibacteria bacterium]
MILLPLLLALFATDPVLDGDPVALRFARAAPGDPNLVEGSFRVLRDGQESLWIPPGEFLEFEVEVDLGVIGDATVGTVEMSSGVEPFVSGLPLPGQKLKEGGPLVAWVRIAAHGGHLGYDLDHSITTRFLPQVWPNWIYSEVQAGSEHRKREIKLGKLDGEWTSRYRGDGHCRSCVRKEHYLEASLPWNSDYHCKKCKRGEHRTWGTARDRAVPAQTSDILGAVYLARSLVRGAQSELKLFMIQKEQLWDVTLERGVVKNIKVGAGTFTCQEVRLVVKHPEGEANTNSQFAGLFGIKGALKIWLHQSTGVPVLIEGDVPVGGIIDLHASVRLVKYRGTPKAFLGTTGR